MTTQRMLPLYEGKMGAQYNHRAATFVGQGDTDIEPYPARDPEDVVLPRYWVREAVVQDQLSRRQWGTSSALMGFRRVARNTDERTAIATTLPFGAASYGWILSAGPNADDLAFLLGQYNSFVFDYLLRQFLSQPSIPQGTFAQLPTVEPSAPPWSREFVRIRVLELAYTAYDMRAFAGDLGDGGEPFVWDPERRFWLRAELDAAFFHLYGVERDDVDYIMETFPIVKRKDLAAHGSFRTKEAIVSIYDAMAQAIASGTEYETVLSPPPGKGPRHPVKEQAS